MFKINASAGEVRLITRLVYASLSLGAFQLFLGASPLVVILSLASGLATILPCLVYGFGRTVGILYLLVWFQFSFGALLAKSILFQPLDSNLFQPVLSHLILLAGAVSFSIGALVAFSFGPLQRNLVRPELEPRKLTVLAAIFTALWVSAFFVEKLGANGAAIAVFLRNYLFLAFICETVSTILRTGGRRTISRFGAVLATLAVGFSVAVNSKEGILDIGACYLLALLSLGRRPPMAVWASVVPAFALLTFVLTPAIHVVRGDRDRLGPFELIAATTSTAISIVERDSQTLAKIDRMRYQESAQSYNLYQSHYLGRSDVWYDRFILTGYIDAITRRVTYDGPFFGWNFVLSQTAEALPRQFLDTAKNRYYSGAQITRSLGLTARDAAVFPTVPLPIELFVAGGFWAIFVIGIPTITIAVAAFNLFAFQFRGNVWAVFFLATYGFFFTVEMYLQYVFLVFRQLPTDAIVITVSCALAALMYGARSREGGALSATPKRSISHNRLP
jgi:hypothetical protein